MKNKKMNLLEVGYEMAQGLYNAEIIDAITMHDFDVLCLSPAESFSLFQMNLLRLPKKSSNKNKTRNGGMKI